MQVCLPKHNYNLYNSLLTVKPRAVDPHCFDADPDPDQYLDADPDPDPGGGGGLSSAKNVHPPWQNPRYAPGGGPMRMLKFETVPMEYSGAGGN
jgi:hypothetical protein